jgi:hypothetical protein
MSVKNYNLQYISLLDLVKVKFQHRHVFTFLLVYFFSFIEKKVTYYIEYYHKNIILFKGMAISEFEFTIGIDVNFKAA